MASGAQAIFQIFHEQGERTTEVGRVTCRPKFNPIQSNIKCRYVVAELSLVDALHSMLNMTPLAHCFPY